MLWKYVAIEFSLVILSDLVSRAIALTDGISENTEGWRSDVIHPRHHFNYSGGVAILFTQAHIQIQGQTHQQILEDDCQYAAFALSLQAGDTHLTTTFTTDEGMARGAYYVYVRYLGA